MHKVTARQLLSASQGGTCGFGMRGQKARSGSGVRDGFEGGQTALYRRLPKLKGIAGGTPLDIIAERKRDKSLCRWARHLSAALALVLANTLVIKPKSALAHALSLETLYEYA